MDRTERWCHAASIALLLVSSVLPAAAAPATGGASEGDPSEPPAVFAERITASHGGSTGKGSMQNAIELIVLATVCAIGVAFYSSASSGRDGTDVSTRIRRR
jgi:hypothetical protein